MIERGGAIGMGGCGGGIVMIGEVELVRIRVRLDLLTALVSMVLLEIEPVEQLLPFRSDFNVHFVVSQ